MNTLLKRSLTGMIYVAVIVSSVLWTSWAFPLVCSLFGLLGLIEYDKLTRNTATPSGLAAATDITFAMLMLAPAIFGLSPVLAIVPFSLYIFARLILQLYLKSQTPVADTAKSMLSICWIVIPLVMLEFLWTMSQSLVLTVFAMIWINDTGAFCTGSLMGRTKLFERISPKKTWEGFTGGLLLTAIFGYFAPDMLEACGLSPFAGRKLSLALGIGVSIFATFGDLCESQFKRALHAKDSGKILPGHGGILDRIDSLLAVSATLFTAWLFELLC